MSRDLFGDIQKLGEEYCKGKLVRVVGKNPHFEAGLIISRDTHCCIMAAPILSHYMGSHQDKIRASLQRLGYKATVVRDFQK